MDGQEDLGIESVAYGHWDGDELTHMKGFVPTETSMTLHVNGHALVGLTCTPVLLQELALGFLFNEALIEGMKDIAVVEVRNEQRCLDVWLEREVALPEFRVVTSGCSRGTTFRDIASTRLAVDSNLRVSPSIIATLVGKPMSDNTPLYREAGGLHAAMLADGDRVLCTAEDIGRHNALDKVAGMCLRQEWSMEDRIIVTTGRISSEILAKAARMKVPIIISRSSPTSLSVRLAQEWGITLVGYARHGSFRVYAGQERVSK